MKNIIFLIFSFLILSCEKEHYYQQIYRPSDCDSIYFTWEKDIHPIFNSNCNFKECHATGGRGSYDYTKYEVVAARIRAGTVDYRLDLPFDDPQHMPEKMRLNPRDYFIIKTWIKQGYAKN